MQDIPELNRKSKKKLRRTFTPGKLLLILLILSAGQYFYTGKVSWLTESFRWIENAATGLVDNPEESLGKAGAAITDIAESVGEALPVEATGPSQATTIPGAEISWSAPAFKLSGRVVKVNDGDTITILDAERAQHKIRLHGIDTPEYDQPYGKAAKRKLSDLVSGKGVGIDIKDIDRYGRTVGVVYINSSNINLAMVRSGYAWWYRYFARSDDALREAEEQARANELGLWADPDPVAPWDWRRRDNR